MKTQTSVIVAGGLALALWGGISSRDLFAQAEAAPQAFAPKPAATLAEKPSDLQRRAELNARLRSMIAEGKGGRLADAPPAARSTSIRTAHTAPATRQPRSASRPSRVETAATIAPPAYDPSKARPISTRRGYTPPRLDLTTPANVPNDPVACLTQAIYYEARNESEEGQAAVAEVVLNRAGSGRYPRDICQVVLSAQRANLPVHLHLRRLDRSVADQYDVLGQGGTYRPQRLCRRGQGAVAPFVRQLSRQLCAPNLVKSIGAGKAHWCSYFLRRRT